MSKGNDIYTVLRKLLEQARDSKAPITSVDAYDNNDVRKLAGEGGVNKVSDTLGHLWRSGYIDKFPAPKSPNSQAKFCYQWKEEKRVNVHSGPLAPDTQAKHDQAVAKAVASGAARLVEPAHEPVSGRRVLLSRPTIEITQDGGLVTIDLPALQIIIKPRG